MDMKMKGFVIGLTAAVIFGLLCVAIYYKAQRNHGKRQYDERQRTMQGKAYCAAFFSLIAYLVINGIYEMMLPRWADGLTTAMFGVFIGVSVYGMVCIFNDAYTPLRKKPGAYILMFLGLAVFNASIGWFNLHGEPIFENGMLTYRCVNFAVAAMLVLVSIVYGARVLYLKLREGREGEEDENEEPQA